MLLLAVWTMVPAMGQNSGQEHSADEHDSGHDGHAVFQAHKLALVTGYGFLTGAINEEGWAIGMVLSYDIKEVNSAITLGLAVSKRFGK